MRSGKVSQTTTNIYGGKRNEETPLLYNEESFEPFSDSSHSSWETITIVSAEAKVDEGATQTKVPVQMDKAFLSATVLQLYSSKPLRLVVASLALMFVMYNIVVHDAIIPFAAAILLCGIRLIVIEWNRRQRMLFVGPNYARNGVFFGGGLGRVDVDKFPGYGLKLSPDTAQGMIPKVRIGFKTDTTTQGVIPSVGVINVMHGVVDSDPDLHNISEAGIQDIQVSNGIYIPYQGGDTKRYSEGFGEYTRHVRSLSQEYKGLRKEQKKDFVEKRIIYHFHNSGRTFFRWDENKDEYVPFDLNKEEDLIILRNKVMQKIRDIKVVEMQNQPDPSSAAQSMGNENVVSTCDPTVAVATVASIQARRDTPINSSLSTATAEATSYLIKPSPPKKRKTGREEHHVQEGRTLFHESHQDILATPNSTAKCDLSGVAIQMTPKEVEESVHIFIIDSKKKNITNSKGFDEYTELVRSLSQDYKHLPPKPHTRKREFVQEKIINHFHGKGRRFFILGESEDHYVPFNLDEERELLILTKKVMQKIRDTKCA